jgi:hypothetical protein
MLDFSRVQQPLFGICHQQVLMSWRFGYITINRFIPDENRAIMRSQGGIHCIIKTMHRHQNNADIQESGCGALWNLAIDGTQYSLITFCSIDV